MLTALFPKDGMPITINQGNTGDCYLLASLDCIFNSGPEGIAKIKSLFTETEHGITVRIKRTRISAFLKTNNLQGKYNYFHDKNRNEDVFFISKERLKWIDAPSIGVKTNSLAVKILERLSSYYFVADWSNDSDLMASVIAHNLSNRHKDSSPEFVGLLLNINTEYLTDLDKVIKLKTLDPAYPVYIGMKYGVKDAYSKTHPRHALRLDKIIPDSSMPGGYKLVLVNPWYNDKTESYSIGDIKSRDYAFCFFNLSFPKAQLTRQLLSFSLSEGQDILNTPALLTILLEQQALKSNFGSEDIRRCHVIYKKMSKMESLFSLFSTSEKVVFFDALYAANGRKEQLLQSLIVNLPRIEVVDFILNNETLPPEVFLLLIERCLREKDQALFKLLKDAELLKYIVLSSVYDNLLLTNLIELHLKQDTVDIESCLAIAEFIRSSNLNPFLDPLSVELSEKKIFNTLLARTIDETAQQLKVGKEEAKKEVYLGLISYYFNNNSTYISRLGSLHTLFSNPAFPKSLIEDIVPPEWFLVYGTVQFLNDPDLLLSVVAEKLCQPALRLSTNQLNTIFMDLKTEDPRVLFFSLYKLSNVNNELAQTVLHQLIEQFKSKFCMDFSDFAEEVTSEKASTFRSWFIKSMPLSEQKYLSKKAQQVVSNYLSEVQNFSFYFDDSYTVALVDKKAYNLTSSLHKLVNHKNFLKAQQLFGEKEIKELAITIQKTLKQKINEIEMEANKQRSALESAAKDVECYVKKIKDFTCCYDEIYTVSEVETKQLSSSEMLRKLTNNRTLKNALKTLGFLNDYPSSLVNALKKKEEEINSASLKRKKELAQAEAVITKLIDSVTSLPISFEGLASICSVSQRSADQLEQLYTIRANPELLRAQKTLGLKEQVPSKLLAKIEEKAHIIIQKAEAQINCFYINEFNQCLKKIHEFSIFFDDKESINSIDAHKKQLLYSLRKMVDEFYQEMKYELTEQSKQLEQTILAKEKEIYEAAAARNNFVEQKKAQIILQQSGFFDHLAVLLQKTKELEEKNTKSENYRLASLSARALYEALDGALTDFLTAQGSNIDKLATFKKATNLAIKHALPTLEKHRGWKQFLLDVANFFLILGTCSISYFSTQRFRLFTVPTDSAKKILDLQQNIKNLSGKENVMEASQGSRSHSGL